MTNIDNKQRIIVRDLGTRKITLAGGYTFRFCLPREWAKKKNLKAGDVMQLYETPEGNLEVVPYLISEDESNITNLIKEQSPETEL